MVDPSEVRRRLVTRQLLADIRNLRSMLETAICGGDEAAEARYTEALKARLWKAKCWNLPVE